jgi:hypothetical protein
MLWSLMLVHAVPVRPKPRDRPIRGGDSAYCPVVLNDVLRAPIYRSASHDTALLPLTRSQSNSCSVMSPRNGPPPALAACLLHGRPVLSASRSRRRKAEQAESLAREERFIRLGGHRDGPLSGVGPTGGRTCSSSRGPDMRQTWMHARLRKPLHRVVFSTRCRRQTSRASALARTEKAQLFRRQANRLFTNTCSLF